MILKKLKRRCFKKPKSVMIGGLVDYILQPIDERGNEKLAYYQPSLWPENPEHGGINTFESLVIHIIN